MKLEGNVVQRQRRFRRACLISRFKLRCTARSPQFTWPLVRSHCLVHVMRDKDTGVDSFDSSKLYS